MKFSRSDQEHRTIEHLECESNQARQHISELGEREDRCKNSQKAGRKSAMRYSSCFENMNVSCACGEIIFDENNQPIDYTFVFANSAFERSIGLDDIIGKRASEVMPDLDESLPDLVRVYAKVAFGGQSIRRELCFESLGKCFLSSIYSMKKGYFMLILSDVTELKQAEENMRLYASQVLRAQEQERKRIARELHDDTIQAMLSLLTDIDKITKEPLSDMGSRRVANMKGKIVSMMDGLRRFTHELRPGLLEQLGLIPALESLIEDLITEPSDFVCRLQVVGARRRLQPDTELALFRIVQEAMNNARNNARVQNSTVTVEFSDDIVKVCITDDGCGFNVPKTITDFTGQGKFGLTGMLERTWLVGGHLSVNSQVGKGTKITVCVPVQVQITQAMKTY
jgi:signal transduction histidine kinase